MHRQSFCSIAIWNVRLLCGLLCQRVGKNMQIISRIIRAGRSSFPALLSGSCCSLCIKCSGYDQYGSIWHIQTQTLHSQTWRLPVLTQNDLRSQSYNQLSRLETASVASRLSKKAAISSPTAVNQASFATNSENHIGHQPATNMRNSAV